MFRWREKEQQTLEVLLVRRTINEKDAWSGQVAFPGGRRQKKTRMDIAEALQDDWSEWESLRETAQRETMEEVGLDLTLPHVHWIGSLPHIQTHLRGMTVSTQVFYVDAAADEHGYTPALQAAEIADAFWLDVRELYNTQRYAVLPWPLEDMVPLLRRRPALKAVADRLLGRLLFDCIYLPRPGHALPDSARTPPRQVHEFVLWGLTLRMLVNMCALAGMPMPMRADSQRFEGRVLGELVLFCQRYPDKAVAGGATVLAIGLVSLVYSHL